MNKYYKKLTKSQRQSNQASMVVLTDYLTEIINKDTYYITDRTLLIKSDFYQSNKITPHAFYKKTNVFF